MHCLPPLTTYHPAFCKTTEFVEAKMSATWHTFTTTVEDAYGKEGLVDS